jgi:cell division protein FtsI (penicillin-binding protein 3)
MYVEKKNPSLYAIHADSSAYFFSGYNPDIRRVMNTIGLRYSDSAGSENWSQLLPGQQQPTAKGVRVESRIMPNVRGMGLKDAIYLLENMGLKVSVSGRGRVIAQSVTPGTMLSKGVTVILELS